MSIVELVTMRAKPGHEDYLGRTLPKGLAVLAEAEGCLGTAVMRCIERPDEFVLRIEWVSVAAHEDFRAAPEFAHYRAPFADHLAEVVGFAHYTRI
ncbi:putative quinol monooxygenase [Amycolatopsis pithecellobii]|nr:antibiotic biosynthesis monooxygenase family protein [Amycolatopsis pithecellobii]